MSIALGHDDDQFGIHRITTPIVGRFRHNIKIDSGRADNNNGPAILELTKRSAWYVAQHRRPSSQRWHRLENSGTDERWVVDQD